MEKREGFENLIIRRAIPSDSKPLTELTIRSKATWGYSAEFMQRAIPAMTVSETYLAKAVVFLAEIKGQLAGYYGMGIPEHAPELEFFFIAPEYFGYGLGRFLWQHALEEFRKLGHRKFKIVSDPHAQGFYLKMGAKPMGMCASPIDPAHRQVPWFEFMLPS